MIRRVHLPQTMSAVRQTGQRELLMALISLVTRGSNSSLQ